VFIDPDLLQYDEVWAAAGTWHDLCGIEPDKLVEASEGLVTDLKRGRVRQQARMRVRKCPNHNAGCEQTVTMLC